MRRSLKLNGLHARSVLDREIQPAFFGTGAVSSSSETPFYISIILNNEENELVIKECTRPVKKKTKMVMRLAREQGIIS